jgi:hypothetical protein
MNYELRQLLPNRRTTLSQILNFQMFHLETGRAVVFLAKLNIQLRDLRIEPNRRFGSQTGTFCEQNVPVCETFWFAVPKVTIHLNSELDKNRRFLRIALLFV